MCRVPLMKTAVQLNLHCADGDVAEVNVFRRCYCTSENFSAASGPFKMSASVQKRVRSPVDCSIVLGFEA